MDSHIVTRSYYHPISTAKEFIEELNLIPMYEEQKDKLLKDNADLLKDFNTNFAFLLFVQADIWLRREVRLEGGSVL